MNDEFKSAPTTTGEYEVKGQKYFVISHYIGGKDINVALQETAKRKAYAEIMKSA